ESVSLGPGGTHDFSAVTAEGTPADVTWRVVPETAGRIELGGRYTAPEQIATAIDARVEATAGGEIASATVSLVPAAAAVLVAARVGAGADGVAGGDGAAGAAGGVAGTASAGGGGTGETGTPGLRIEPARVTLGADKDQPFVARDRSGVEARAKWSVA